MNKYYEFKYFANTWSVTRIYWQNGKHEFYCKSKYLIIILWKLWRNK